MQILVVDDDTFALRMVEKTLNRMGYSPVLARNGAEALEILQKSEIRLVITDWDMPRMNGLDLCRAVRREELLGYVYIVMLTGREGARQRMEGLYAGADDFMNKPLDPEELLICLKQAERILALETRDATLFALAKLAESRDAETGAHLERVQNYTRLIARHLSSEVKACHGVDEAYIRMLYQTSPLHDLGKVSIPDAVLLKPGPLTPEEREIMKTHAMLGAHTLDAALQRYPNVPFLQMARDIAGMHHEKFDGSGYPQGLVGEQIPLSARIVGLADAYDAITSRRVYKEAASHEEAKAIVIRERGRHFDPELIDAFLRAEQEIIAVKERFGEEDRQQAPVVPPPPPAPPLAGSGTILLVEDDPFLLRKLRELLNATGETLVEARDGEDALRAFEKHHPGIIVSDWEMPRMDGARLCRELRAHHAADHIHFIMLTAHSDKGRLLEAYEAGVDDFVSKPFGAEELLARVRAGIRAVRLQAEMERKAEGCKALNAQLAMLNSRLERLSITDELTGLFNRRQVIMKMEEQWTLSRRYGRPLSIVALDIDHFKRINDSYGHDAGDQVLKNLAVALREQVRGMDALCRMGGEEFLIILPSHTLEEARACAERCRKAIAAQQFVVPGAALTVTISAGVATRVPAMHEFTALLKAGDEALYTAKQTGRNKVCVQAPPTAGLPAASDAAASVATNDAPPADLAALKARCDGDERFVADAIAHFCDDAHNQIDGIVHGLEERNADLLRRAAHSLKGMAGFIEAHKVVELARRIETMGEEKRFSEVLPALEELRRHTRHTTEWLAEKVHPAAPAASEAACGK